MHYTRQTLTSLPKHELHLSFIDTRVSYRGGGALGFPPSSKCVPPPPQHFDNYAVTKQGLLAAKRSNTVILTLQLNSAVLFLENVKNFIKRYRTEFLG